jgi:hypothetical protein
MIGRGLTTWSPSNYSTNNKIGIMKIFATILFSSLLLSVNINDFISFSPSDLLSLVRAPVVIHTPWRMAASPMHILG